MCVVIHRSLVQIRLKGFFFFCLLACLLEMHINPLGLISKHNFPVVAFLLEHSNTYVRVELILGL